MILTFLIQDYILSSFQALRKAALRICGTGQNLNQILFDSEPNMTEMQTLSVLCTGKENAMLSIVSCIFRTIRATFHA
jgi:hypothetical protein